MIVIKTEEDRGTVGSGDAEAAISELNHETRQKLEENRGLAMPPALTPELGLGECVLRRKRGRRQKGATQSGSHGQGQILRDLLM